METTTGEKRLKSTDFNLCLICQTAKVGSKNYKTYVTKPSKQSIEKIINSAKTRVRYGESDLNSVVSNVCDLTAEELIAKGVSYHKICYGNLISAEKIERAKARYDRAVATGKSTEAWKSIIGRPTASSSQTTDLVDTSSSFGPTLRKIQSDSTKCILCQENTMYSLHEVSTASMGLQMLEIGRETNNEHIKARFSFLVATNDPLQAVAYDMKYHLECLVKCKRDIQKSKQVTEEHDTSILKVISELEILSVIKNAMDEPMPVLNMTDVHTTYLNILEDNGVTIPEDPKYKPYLKKLIQENISYVYFHRPGDRTQAEQIISTKAKDAAIDETVKMATVKDDAGIVLMAANILRREMSKQSSWQFNGSFEDYSAPLLLNIFCRNFVKGAHEVQTERRREKVDSRVSLLTQHMAQSFLSSRQVTYKPETDTALFQDLQETPLSLSLAMNVHNKFRSKHFITFLQHLNLSVSYSKILYIENRLASAIQQQMVSNGGLFIPSWMVKDQFVWFALDNIDFLEDTVNGKDTLHGSVLAVYQSTHPNNSSVVSHIDLKSAPSSHKETLQCNVLHCPTPKVGCKVLPFDVSDSYRAIDKCHQLDLLWILSCLRLTEDTEDKTTSSDFSVTWNVFNSLLSPESTVTNISLVPPLIRLPPTDYSVLYTMLMRARGITALVLGPSKLTCISLDLQLYEMAMKLWMSRDDIQKQFIFRPGELHVVMWALAALGKYVEGSGIDQAWVEAGLYSPSTVSQILNGKHIYRGLEAHTITLLSIYDMYFETFMEASPEDSSVFQSMSVKIREAFVDDLNSGKVKQNRLMEEVSKALDTIEKLKLMEKLAMYEATFTKTQIFLNNYVRQILCILSYVRATREKNWELHLETTEALIKYFCAHNHLNYARLLPLYLSTMQYVRKTHSDIWREFQQGNFCVTKSPIGFSSIAPDHAIEHENRALKVTGGVIGITQNEDALNRHLLISSELTRMIDNFKSIYNVGTDITRKEHHEISGRKAKRITENATKLTKVFTDHCHPFSEKCEHLYNLLTGATVSEEVANDITSRDSIGQEAFKSFVGERLTNGNACVWDKLSKCKIRTFKTLNITSNLRVQDKLIKVQEDRQLLQRLVVIARSRGDINFVDAIGCYEFSCIPRSLFQSDGTLLLASDKYTILHYLENMTAPQSPVDVPVTPPLTQTVTKCGETAKILIVDGMVIVNAIKKTPDMNTCNDFAIAFLSVILHMAKDYDEVRLIFDRYDSLSLKSQTRKKRTAGSQTYYRIHDNSLIRNITLKNWLSHPKTKGELTEYLASKILSHSMKAENNRKKFLVTYNSCTKGNTEIHPTLQSHAHEEADTLVILHALSLNKNTEVDIYSTDTDILLELICMYPKLPRATTFVTGKGDLRRKLNVGLLHQKLGPKRADAILGFHAFTGSDVTGRFAGITKLHCFKKFLECDDKILSCLASLGIDEAEPSPAVENELERFVCILYRSSSIKKLKKLRWYLFANKAAASEKLPPTTSSLRPHIRRAQYAAMVWHRSCCSDPQLPSPTSYGWQLKADTMYIPVKCMLPPAPAAVVNLLQCGCKMGCKSRCSCRTHQLQCTELCKCFNNQPACTNSRYPLPPDLDDECDIDNE